VMVFSVGYFPAQDRFGDAWLFFRKHMVALTVGGIAAVAVSCLRVEFLERGANVILLATLAMLVLVVLPNVGVERGGAQRWLRMGGFSLQPTEFLKLGVVLMAARWISRHRDEMRSFVRGSAALLAGVAVCAALVTCQPDFGT